jgi:hypothetical protein
VRWDRLVAACYPDTLLFSRASRDAMLAALAELCALGLADMMVGDSDGGFGLGASVAIEIVPATVP